MTRTIPLHALQICDIWNREKRVSLLKKKEKKKDSSCIMIDH